MSHGEFNFTTHLPSKDVRVYGYTFKDEDEEMSGALIKWRCLFDTRDWGIKSIQPVVDDIVMTLDFIQLRAITDLDKWEFECQCDQVGRRYTQDVVLSPFDVVIDFECNKITIWFRV